jgi:hypothetical protein
MMPCADYAHLFTTLSITTVSVKANSLHFFSLND